MKFPIAFAAAALATRHSEGGSIGVGYDTGLEAFNVSIGFDF